MPDAATQPDPPTAPAAGASGAEAAAADGQDRHAWERPGAHQVADGIYRVPLPLPGDALKAVNVYVIEDGDELVLIDGGWALAESTQLLRDTLASVGRDLREIREFLVTHAHRDHYTQAVTLRAELGARVSLGEGEREALELIRTTTDHPDVPRLLQAGAAGLAAQLLPWGSTLDRSEWSDPDDWLHSGVDIELKTRTLRVIATPGHTTGHVVFRDQAAGLLFAGDHILPHITPSIGVEPAPPPSPLRDFLTSLQLIGQLPDTRLLPAHGPISPSVHERIAELLAHHERRLEATALAVDGGASTGYEVAEILPWTRRRRRLEELDTFNQMLATEETMAHLIVLVERGWLTRTDIDGVAHFARA